MRKQNPKPKAQTPAKAGAKALDKETIIAILRERLPELRRDYSVTYLGLFGSYVRGEQRKRSDVDLLVEFEVTPGLFRYIELEQHLTSLVGRKVDLVMKNALKPTIGIFILREVEPL